MRGCLELPDGSMREKVPAGVVRICRLWAGKALGVSVSQEWTLRVSGA